jgi:2-oxo-4-hydroxy-4-carboxy-5-ureidoimidazoline decarboxylase
VVRTRAGDFQNADLGLPYWWWTSFIFALLACVSILPQITHLKTAHSSNQRYRLGEVNGFSRADFVRVLGPVFEHSPWIAGLTWAKRPFGDRTGLHRALCETVLASSQQEKLALIRAHPDLVGRAALAGTLTVPSTREQASAGLDRLSEEELASFQKYNREYHKKFGFPFVICARLNKKAAILDGFRRRLKNSRAREVKTALNEIFKIAELRLSDLLQPMPAKLTTHVLDTAQGCPAREMKIELWSLAQSRKKRLKTLHTNPDGRTEQPLLAGEEFKPGEYELVFFVGDYFARGIPGNSRLRFLDRVPVRFGIADTTVPYHVPLLCSPWAYSTYRGS